MAQQNKFDYRIKQEGDTWIAEITRRITSRKTSVSKRGKGFTSEQQATEWAKEQLTNFVEHLQESNKRKSEKRTARKELAAQVAAEKEAEAAAYEQKKLQQQEEFALEDQED